MAYGINNRLCIYMLEEGEDWFNLFKKCKTPYGDDRKETIEVIQDGQVIGNVMFKHEYYSPLFVIPRQDVPKSTLIEILSNKLKIPLENFNEVKSE